MDRIAFPWPKLCPCLICAVPFPQGEGIAACVSGVWVIAVCVSRIDPSVRDPSESSQISTCNVSRSAENATHVRLGYVRCSGAARFRVLSHDIAVVGLYSQGRGVGAGPQNGRRGCGHTDRARGCAAIGKTRSTSTQAHEDVHCDKIISLAMRCLIMCVFFSP